MVLPYLAIVFGDILFYSPDQSIDDGNIVLLTSRKLLVCPFIFCFETPYFVGLFLVSAGVLIISGIIKLRKKSSSTTSVFVISLGIFSAFVFWLAAVTILWAIIPPV